MSQVDKMVQKSTKSLLVLGMLTILSLLCSCIEDNPTSLLDDLVLPNKIQQVVLVTTPSWDSPKGNMSCFLRTDVDWKIVKSAVPVMVGRGGLGWGRGLFPIESETGPIKMEGDGKSPAGIFKLGHAFGYSNSAPKGCKLPYRTATDRDYFVDDVNSPDYNTWVSIVGGANKPEKYWKSFERMRRGDHIYELGIVVEHNVKPVVSGRGSAIFLHVWRAKDEATLGCTAMPKENLEELLMWLDPCKNPVLVQIPKSEFRNLHKYKKESNEGYR